jgi:hypothetical protein
MDVSKIALIDHQLLTCSSDHSRILTYAPVSLAALKAFDLDDSGVLPV